MWRWIEPKRFRYYQADLELDLFGEWTLVCCWGGLGSKRGGYNVKGVRSYADGLERIDELNNHRRKRGYVSVETFKDWTLQIAGMSCHEIPQHRSAQNRCTLNGELAFLEETRSERQTDIES